ncbi:MAG TPA: hypothetical protein PKI93_07380 [Alphaproteobacteria bacterium]|nr:hypothetical protein [Alphaproteobacteria bacterium]
MFKLVALVFVVAAPTLAGILATAVMVSPDLMEEGGKWISVAVAVGTLIAVPVSYVVGKAINDLIKKG